MRVQPLIYMADDVNEISPMLLERRLAASTATGSKISLPSIRLRAGDLGEAQRLSNTFSANARRTTTLLLDIEVAIAETARQARLDLAGVVEAGINAHAAGRTIRYVGTVDGLMGLIRDVCAVGIADGVVLIPLSLHPAEVLALEGYCRDSESEQLGVRP